MGKKSTRFLGGAGIADSVHFILLFFIVQIPLLQAEAKIIKLVKYVSVCVCVCVLSKHGKLQLLAN